MIPPPKKTSHHTEIFLVFPHPGGYILPYYIWERGEPQSYGYFEGKLQLPLPPLQDHFLFQGELNARLGVIDFICNTDGHH